MGRSIRVLVVDDHPAFRAAAAAMIDVTPGFDLVGETETGEAALDTVTSTGAELVLMDVNMPGMGGLRAAEVLIREHPDVVVVLVSTDEHAAFSGGSCDPRLLYLAKARLSSDALRGLWRASASHGRPPPAGDLQGGADRG